MSTGRGLWTRLGGNRAGLDVPWQQFFDAVDRVLSDAGEDMAEIEFWIDPVELGGSHKSVDGGCAMASRVGTGKEVVAGCPPSRF